MSVCVGNGRSNEAANDDRQHVAEIVRISTAEPAYRLHPCAWSR
jgi:hypothetical protein